MKEKESKTNKKKPIYKILIIIGSIIGVLLLAIIALYIYVAVSAKKMNLSYDTLKNDIKSHNAAIRYDDENNIIKPEYVEYQNIPTDLIDAVVSIDQPNYFSKNSHDLKKILNPMPLISDVNIHNKTIPMQILDNVSMEINRNTRLEKYVYSLKLAYFSIHVFEKDFTKEEILEYYLNSQYLGGDDYGIAAAAKYYFGKSVSALTLPESAMIAGVIQAPGIYNPYNNIEEAEKRKDIVISRMYNYGYITKEERDNAFNVKIESLLIDKSNVKVIDIQKFVSLEKNEKNYTEYSIDLKKAYQVNSLSLDKKIVEFKYKINDFEVVIKLNNNQAIDYKTHNTIDYLIYDTYVNGNYVYRDNVLENPTITLLEKNVIFKYSGVTDVRGLYLYVVDSNGNVNEIGVLDPANKVIRGTEYTITEDGMVIEGSRIDHNATVIIKDYRVGDADTIRYSLQSEEGCSKALPEYASLLVKAKYTYKIENGILNATPVVSEKVTLKEYVEKNNLCK